MVWIFTNETQPARASFGMAATSLLLFGSSFLDSFLDGARKGRLSRPRDRGVEVM